MADTNQNFSLFKGNALTVEIIISDDANDPINLTGFTVNWSTSRLSPRGCFSSTPVIEKCSGLGSLIITDAVNGLVEFTLLGADTESLSPGNYSHQIVIIDGSGNSTTVTTGIMVLDPSLTPIC